MRETWRKVVESLTQRTFFGTFGTFMCCVGELYVTIRQI